MSEKSILEMVGGVKHINPHYNIKAEKTDKDEMNEEELFCKLFPEYTVNGKPLSPYFDLFESGFEQAENRIEELKLKLEALEGQTPWKDIKDRSEVIGKLTKAKELLREIIDTPVFNQMGGELYENEGYTELVAEAEQFLKDSEVEK